MIPVPIIEHFFKDLGDGKIDGFPFLNLRVNHTGNESLRVHYNIQNEKGGLLVTNVPPYSPAEGVLEVGDVILSVDDTDVGSDGTFEFRENERLLMSKIISDKQIGDTVKIKVMRDGKTRSLIVALTDYTPLVPPLRHFKNPPYYIYGGLIFTVLGTDFLDLLGDDAPANLLNYYYGYRTSTDKRHKEKVMLVSVLPDEINVGYHDFGYEIVGTVNGTEIKSFKQFVKLLQHIASGEPRTIIKTENNNILVLNNNDIAITDAEILKRYKIPSQSSKDVAKWIAE